MRAWAFRVVISWVLAFAVACGDDAVAGDAGEPDAQVANGQAGTGGGAPEPDGGEPVGQSDAAEPIADAGDVGDASGDAGMGGEPTICENHGGCTSVGIMCTAAGAVRCVKIAGGCFARAGAVDDCNEAGHEVCQTGVGCTCAQDSACGPLDGNGKNGVGTHCGGIDAVVECVAHAATGCVYKKTTANTRTCALPLVCSGEPGAADCGCPVADPGTHLPGTGCVTSQRLCADDGGSIVVCQEVVADDLGDVLMCNVWDDGTFVPDDPNDPDDVAGDDCQGDGLGCAVGGNPQCVCPANGTSDFYVNGHPMTKLRRFLPGRLGLVQNGRQHPTICSFDNVTVALDNAMTAIGPGNANRSRVILDNEDDAIGSIDSLVPAVGGDPVEGKVRVVFDDELFPWEVPNGIEIITVDRASAGAPPGTRIDPRHFTVVVDNFANDEMNDAGFGAAVNVVDTGLISGFTLIEGGCDVREPQTQEIDGSLDDYCYDKYENWPNVMVQVLDHDGIRNPASRNIDSMNIEGGGGPDPEDSFRYPDGSIDGLPEDGTFAFDGDTGMVTFTPDDSDVLADLADILDNGATVFLVFFEPTIDPGNDGATGAFGPVSVVYDVSNDPIGLGWYDPHGASGTYVGTWSHVLHDDQWTSGAYDDYQHSNVADSAHSNRKTIDVGILVGRDDLQHLDDGSPSDPDYGDTNAQLDDVRVSHFASRPDSSADLSRYGILVDDDFPGSPVFVADAVSFHGGLLVGNDTGLLVSDGHVEIDATRNSVLANSPGDQGQFEIAGSTGQGMEVFDRENVLDGPRHETTVTATDIYVHDTRYGDPDVFATQDRFASSPYNVPGPSLAQFTHGDQDDDLNGNGINVTGPGSATDGLSFETLQLYLTHGRIDRNAENGLSVVNTAPAEDRALFSFVQAFETVFGGNGTDGVRVKYGADLVLLAIESSNNGDNGVHVETSVRGSPTALEDGYGGFVVMAGGHIHDNGLDAVYNGGHGILAQGDNVVITDASPADNSARLLVEHNGFGGLYADDGTILLNRTDFRRNGANDLCEEDDEEGHFMQVTITAADDYYARDFDSGGGPEPEAVMSMVDCKVSEGYGGGIEIDSIGDGTQENVIDGSLVEYNEGVRDCDSEDASDVSDALDEPNEDDDGDTGVDTDAAEAEGDAQREYAERDGIEVTRQGRLFFVNQPSIVAFNGKNTSGSVVSDGVDGIEVAGQLPLPPPGVGQPVWVTVNDNSGDGITVSCAPKLLEPLSVSYSICGFAQLLSSTSSQNDHNGAVAHGHLFWQGSDTYPALIDQNGANGVLVQHVDSTDIDNVDCTFVGKPGPCELAEDAANAPDVSHALGWAETGSYRADIRTELLDVTIAHNDENGVQVDAAPFAVEPDLEPGLGNICLARNGAPAPPLTGPVADSEIEDADPVCEHVTGFRIHSTESDGRSVVKYNGGWGLLIGKDDQDQNIYAAISGIQLYENVLGGIDVHQNTLYGLKNCADGLDVTFCRCDDIDLPYPGVSPIAETVGCTATTILSNNIFNNGGPGLFIRRSQQKPLAMADRRVISSNDVHHNAVAGQGCANADMQSFSQIHFEGPVILSDPDASDASLKDGSHPADMTCYLGTDLTDPATTESECARMNDAVDVLAGGINNHCLWTGTQCRVAWDMAGTVGGGECGMSDNRIYAYVNDMSLSQYTQKALVADDGAFVLARRNTWGVLGADNGTYAIGSSEIDYADACGTLSSCTPASPP